ncbi:hypothetical protein [Metabacillus sp. RGM 3146]|uniref:hypothetical protein n=1 Tax=Metabacillus sp. RGM 3146 TaxID=3401092 RepID=UPI003B9A09DE
MPNIFWYLMLVIIIMPVFAAAIKKEPYILLCLWLFNSGLSYMFELVVLVIFKGYQYKPGFFQDPFEDSIFGSIFSQGISVPLAAAIAAIYKVKLPGILFISFMLASVEELFLSIGIYEHYWWKSFYTMILLPMLFYLSKCWHLLLQRNSRLTFAITLYFGISTLSISATWLATAIHPFFQFHLGIFQEQNRDHTLGNALYCILSGVIYTMIPFSESIQKRLLAFGFLILADVLLILNGIILLNTLIDYLSLFVIHFIMLTMAFIIKSVFVKIADVYVFRNHLSR